MNDVYVYNTSLFSDNLGDEIINFYCNKAFEELNINIIRELPTHIIPSNQNLDEDKLKIVTGTNIIGPRIDRSKSLWKIPINLNMCENIGLMGCGWARYEVHVPLYTKIFLNKFLSNSYIHSVRDSYSQKKLQEIVPQALVLNTACPTMWGLTISHCEKISLKKSKTVVTTITDYSQNSNDWIMLDILLKNYDEVYIWLQGENDYQYLKNYNNFSKLNIINATLEDYNKFLESHETDYIGTRLHAGIYVLNYKKRSIIISIDNRANEIAKDTNLPIIQRENITSQLEAKIKSNWKTDINLPLKNINKWKKQFS